MEVVEVDMQVEIVVEIISKNDQNNAMDDRSAHLHVQYYYLQFIP
jgi:hypothetical protein